MISHKSMMRKHNSALDIRRNPALRDLQRSPRDSHEGPKCSPTCRIQRYGQVSQDTKTRKSLCSVAVGRRVWIAAKATESQISLPGTHSEQRTASNAQRTHSEQRTACPPPNHSHSEQRTESNAQRATHSEQRTASNAQRACSYLNLSTNSREVYSRYVRAIWDHRNPRYRYPEAPNVTRKGTTLQDTADLHSTSHQPGWNSHFQSSPCTKRARAAYWHWRHWTGTERKINPDSAGPRESGPHLLLWF
jgi:hypothetical protein